MSLTDAETVSRGLLDDRGAVAGYTHNKCAAAAFLKILDPAAQEFTFQFFSDHGPKRAEISHGSLDAVWHKVLALNTAGVGGGVFVTINETDFKGRKRENIVRARALFVDADSAEQLRHCDGVIHETGCTPTMVVRTSPERAHFYWVCNNLSLREYSDYQVALIDRLGTDCQRRRDHASARRREYASMIVVKRPPNWGPFRKASGFGGVIRGRV